MGFDYTLKRFRVRGSWSFLPPSLWFSPFRALAEGSDPITPPWPDVVLASGRQTVALSVAIRKRSRAQTFSIHLQDPKVAERLFDVIVVPRHDGRRGPRVLTTLGAIHRVNPRLLARAAADFGDKLAHLPRPRIAVLIGGSSKRHTMTTTDSARLGDRIAAFARDSGAGLMVTPSRRTGSENASVLRARLDGLPLTFWRGEGENPYLGFLAAADAVIVTNDSVSMVSEAAATGKPVYVVPVEPETEKFRHFHEEMRAAGVTRPLGDKLESWDYSPLDEGARIAEEIQRRMGRHPGGTAG